MAKTKFQSVTVNWWARQETLGKCADSLLAFLLKLKEHNPALFGQLYGTAYSKKAALSKPIKLDRESMKFELSEKSLKEDAIPEYTFSSSFWNGNENDGEEAGIDFSLGSGETKLWANTITISLPVEGEQYEFYHKKENQDALVKLMTDYWEPERLMIDEDVIWNKHEQ